MMDRCAGIVLFGSAPKEIIDLHHGPAHKTLLHSHTPSHTYTHILEFHPYDCAASPS